MLGMIAPGAAASLDLAWLEHAPRERAMEFLECLPGVGRKTAACVLLFSYDRPELPVDTHVYRVCVAARPDPARRPRSRRRTTTLRRSADPADVYELHVNLLRHGRRLCRPQRPALRAVPAAAPLPLRARARRLAEP